MELIGGESIVPPQFGGLLASIAGMIVGSLLPQWYRQRGGPVPAR
jgi:hypothetical protein